MAECGAWPSTLAVSGLKRRTPLRADPDKTRDWQRRSRTKTKRSPRGRGLNPVSKKRRASLGARRNTVVPDGPRDPVTDGPDHAFRTWITQLVCAVRLGRELERVDPAHRLCVRRNGDWIARPEGWEGNIIPLSRLEHEAQHQMGIESYQRSRSLDMAGVCVTVGDAYRRGWTAHALSAAARQAGGYEHVDLDDPGATPWLEAP